MVANVVFWVPILMVVALAKLLVPVAAWRRWTSRVMIQIAQAWISCNGAIFGLLGVLRLRWRAWQVSTRRAGTWCCRITARG